jgi:branched-chain amino acid transport system substrate-binding protein
MRKKITAIGLVAASGLLLAGCSAPTGNDSEAIVIAQVGDYSGDWSFYDVPFRDGMQIAVDEVNAAGGIDGVELNLLTIDGRGDQAESVRGVEEALDAGAVYISGSTASGAWQAQAAVACAEGVPITTGDGSSPTLVTDAGDCAFHVLMLDTIQGAVGAEYALDQGYENAYVLLSSDDAYTAGLGKYFADAFEHGGGAIVAEEEFRIGASDFNVQVTNIAAMSPAPDVIYLSMFTPDTPQFLRQLRAGGIDTPVISGDGSVDASVLEAGAAAEGLVATFHAWPSNTNGVAEFLSANFPDADATSAPQHIVSAAGYDEVMLMVQAIKAAGEATPEAIIAALGGLSYEGITGSLTIDPETRQASKSVTLMSVTEGQYVYLDSFVPLYVPTVG